jgi:hypothetical protein
MEAYPRMMAELEARFSTEEACRLYLFGLRWLDGYRYPRCDGGSAWPTERWLFMCASCGMQVSVTAGTIFEGTRTPLPTWFRTIWWVVTQKNGASVLGLQRVLGLESYEATWTWLHKIRRAMVRPGRERLSGRIEGDIPWGDGGRRPRTGDVQESSGSRCCAIRWEWHRVDSDASNSRCLGGESAAVRGINGRIGQRDPHGWLVGICRIGGYIDTRRYPIKFNINIWYLSEIFPLHRKYFKTLFVSGGFFVKSI